MILCAKLELVVAVVKDAKYPHAKFKCESATSMMSLQKCCAARDNVTTLTIRCMSVLILACVTTCISIQKSYQPDLKVEPTKQMKHQMEKK